MGWCLRLWLLSYGALILCTIIVIWEYLRILRIWQHMEIAAKVRRRYREHYQNFIRRFPQFIEENTESHYPVYAPIFQKCPNNRPRGKGANQHRSKMTALRGR